MVLGLQGEALSQCALVDDLADIHLKPPWLTKEPFVARGAAAVAVASGDVLGIRLGFHHQALQLQDIG